MKRNKLFFIKTLFFCYGIVAIYGNVYAQDVSSYINQGFDYYEQGNYDYAISEYDKALAIEPNNSTALANRATAYAKKGDFDKAISDYNKAIAANPKDPNVNMDAAIKYFGEALNIGTDNSNKGQFYYDRSVAYFRKAQYDNCWDDVNKAIELGYSVNPKFLNALKEATGRNQ